MDYINYFYETLYDVYNQWYYEYYITINFSKSNIQDTHEIEIVKLIKEVENEIRLDKEIKELEYRYNNLCDEKEDDNNDDNNNKSNNDGAIKLINKKIKIVI